jgi:uncharacterized membrane protein YczE
MKRSEGELAKRIVVFLFGVFCMSFGIALSKQAELGTTPISTVPAVLSDFTPLSIGEMTFLVNLIFIALQIVILRCDYRKSQLLQLPGLLVFSAFIDINMWLCRWIQTDSYILEWVLCILSAVAVAFGVFLTLKSDVLVMPGDGLAAAISLKFNKPFAKMKICVDSSLVISATVISLTVFRTLVDVREGTIFAALAVGSLIKIYDKLIGKQITAALTGGDRMVSSI